MGTASSMAVGLIYGGTEAKILKYAAGTLGKCGTKIAKYANFFAKEVKQVSKAEGTTLKVVENVAPQIEKIVKNTSSEGVRQIWSSTKNRSSVTDAYKHWKNHGKEFPELYNSKEYVAKAHNFLRNPSPLSRMRPNGEMIRYDPLSNTFGAYTKDGVPKTMFKPGVSKPLPSKYSTPLDYFYGQ